MGFISYMASVSGRSLRMTAGAIIVVLAVVALHGVLEAIVVILGAVLIAVGIFDVCLFAPLVGKPFSGKAIRANRR
jgi:hypothetical protein